MRIIPQGLCNILTERVRRLTEACVRIVFPHILHTIGNIKAGNASFHALIQVKLCSKLENPFEFSSLLLVTHNRAKLPQVSELFLLELWSTIPWSYGDPRAQMGLPQHQHSVTLSALLSGCMKINEELHRVLG